MDGDERDKNPQRSNNLDQFKFTAAVFVPGIRSRVGLVPIHNCRADEAGCCSRALFLARVSADVGPPDSIVLTKSVGTPRTARVSHASC
jgi:hypothetical protein